MSETQTNKIQIEAEAIIARFAQIGVTITMMSALQRATRKLAGEPMQVFTGGDADNRANGYKPGRRAYSNFDQMEQD